ncbi:hypothetical protein PPL_00913 [Heterostelium album PN500]|uniref:Uncharacterized protein n=1 Tax=Heterostelium pallidum (strain ATCC 26659 / Pp 5 / PN500) TaxID=670386 RepID=D3AYZ4_HETP5|nr:hypothetical protein PPL_00913 [Heterostelium album PN500]EFA85684.1 hypothetical protein PPL_00913 [Heterostelium album PN500]|eukprot:XP_020437791.1 hypothetical protein PPL_00913 [Heterostelium album PN500]
MLSLFLLLVLLSTSSISNATKTTITNEQIFNEELLVKPLPNSKIYTHVQFTTEWSANFNDQSTFKHYDLFSRSIGDLIYNDYHTPLNITYYQAIPWYLRVYFHTFQFAISSNDQTQQQQQQTTDYSDRLFFKNVSPAETRSSPSTLELQFELPANSVASMSIEFDKVFLHYTEHPPDANRGFDLGSGIVTVQLDESKHSHSIDIEWSPYTYSHNNNDNTQTLTTIPVRVYTEGLLITLPTPDFSMLYNVITLTGTVFALFFGSMINILIRRLKDTFTGEDFVSDRPIAKIYRKLMKFIDGNK